jgi:hypothetical protein
LDRAEELARVLVFLPAGFPRRVFGLDDLRVVDLLFFLWAIGIQRIRWYMPMNQVLVFPGTYHQDKNQSTPTGGL